jgi:hypothetical protein
VILYVKSRFFFIARGIQLDNGVTSPWVFGYEILYNP